MQFLAVHKAHTTVQLQNLQPFSSSYTVTFLDLTDDQDLGCRLCKEDYFLCQQSIQMLIFLLLPRKIQYSVQLGKKEKKSFLTLLSQITKQSQSVPISPTKKEYEIGKRTQTFRSLKVQTKLRLYCFYFSLRFLDYILQIIIFYEISLLCLLVTLNIEQKIREKDTSHHIRKFINYSLEIRFVPINLPYNFPSYKKKQYFSPKSQVVQV